MLPAPAATTTAAITRAGLIACQVPAIEVGAVHRLDGGLRLFIASHLDESEPTRPSRVPFLDHLCPLYLPEAGKRRTEILVSRVIAKVAYENIHVALLEAPIRCLEPTEHGPIRLRAESSGTQSRSYQSSISGCIKSGRQYG